MGSKQIRSQPVLQRKSGTPPQPRARISPGGAASGRTSKMIESELAKLAKKVDSTGDREASMTATTQKTEKRTAILANADQTEGVEYELDVESTGVTEATPHELLRLRKDLEEKVDRVYKDILIQIAGAVSAVGAISDSTSPLMTGVADVQTTATGIAQALNNAQSNVNGISTNLDAVSQNVLALQTSVGAIEKHLQTLASALHNRFGIETFEPVSQPKDFTLVFPEVPEDADAQVDVLDPSGNTLLTLRPGSDRRITVVPQEDKPPVTYVLKAYNREYERVTYPRG